MKDAAALAFHGAVLQQCAQREALRDEHAAIAKAVAGGDCDRDRATALITGHAGRASIDLADILTPVLAHSRGDTP